MFINYLRKKKLHILLLYILFIISTIISSVRKIYYDGLLFISNVDLFSFSFFFSSSSSSLFSLSRSFFPINVTTATQITFLLRPRKHSFTLYRRIEIHLTTTDNICSLKNEIMAIATCYPCAKYLLLALNLFFWVNKYYKKYKKKKEIIFIYLVKWSYINCSWYLFSITS